MAVATEIDLWSHDYSCLLGDTHMSHGRRNREGWVAGEPGSSNNSTGRGLAPFPQ